MRYAILSSGSCANSYIFQDDQTTVVIDNGLSCRKFEERCGEAGFDPSQIDLLFLTHLHSDHAKGIELLSRKYEIPLVSHWAHDDGQLFKKGLHKRLEIETGREYSFNNMKFTSFRTSHDSPNSLSYHLIFDELKFTLITDTGKTTSDMYRYSVSSDILFLEANYSKIMLAEGDYPQHLKKRISSTKGHLSNDDAGRFMTEVTAHGDCRLKHIHLCHLSKNNNSPDKVLEEVGQVYRGNTPWSVCPRGELINGT